MGYHHSSQGPNEIEGQEGGRIITVSITTVYETQYFQWDFHCTVFKVITMNFELDKIWRSCYQAVQIQV